jgi:hypothetical protein
MPPFQQHFSYIVGVSFIGGGNRRKPPSCLKSLTIFISWWNPEYLEKTTDLLQVTRSINDSSIFSSPDPNVSYCHHVVRRKLFQKSSPLKVLNQWKPKLVGIITRVSSFKIVSGDAVHQPKIEHMVK